MRAAGKGGGDRARRTHNRPTSAHGATAQPARPQRLPKGSSSRAQEGRRLAGAPHWHVSNLSMFRFLNVNHENKNQ